MAELLRRWPLSSSMFFHQRAVYTEPDYFWLQHESEYLHHMKLAHKGCDMC